jgi:hypothetical protein
VSRWPLQLASGFNSVLALEHMAEFDASELELLLCGLPAIDLNDWKAHVEYRSGYNPDHAVIKRFWQVVEDMGDDGKAKLLRFVTGTSALPPVRSLPATAAPHKHVAVAAFHT